MNLIDVLCKIVGCEPSQLEAWVLRHAIPYQFEGDAFINLNKERNKEKARADKLRLALEGMVLAYPYLHNDRYVAALNALQIECVEDLKK